jgi:hypothetical protein
MHSSVPRRRAVPRLPTAPRHRVGPRLPASSRLESATGFRAASWLGGRWESLRSGTLARRAAGVPGRRGLQICLGLVWLIDAGLQYQTFMFGPFFVTLIIEPASASNPATVASPAAWVSHMMLRHIVVYNAAFATIQLLIAVGILWRRTLRPALAASVVWALLVWWLGEGLGGILTGASPLMGVPGAVVLYALIAILLWPTDRAPAPKPMSPATSGPLGATAARLLWLVLWASFSYYLLLPANRAPGAISGIFSVTDGQPGWIVSIMNGLSSLAGQRGLEISVALAVLCAVVAVGVFARPAVKPALILAMALGLLFWIAEGLGGIFTGQGTDFNTGPLLVLLAACFWPVPGAAAAGTTTASLEDASIRARRPVSPAGEPAPSSPASGSGLRVVAGAPPVDDHDGLVADDPGVVT